MEQLQVIQDSQAIDLKKIAKCHIAAFPKSLSSRLGLAYCVKMLEWYLTSDNKFLFHIILEDGVAGYCGGFMRKGELHGSSTGMTQHASKVGILALLLRPWLLVHPKITRNYKFIWRNILLLFSRKQSNKPAENSNRGFPIELTAGLVVIGVDPKYQGKGFGSILLKEFEKKAIAMNCSRLILTVESSNKKAILAYQHNGWVSGQEKDDHLLMFKSVK